MLLVTLMHAATIVWSITIHFLVLTVAITSGELSCFSTSLFYHHVSLMQCYAPMTKDSSKHA
jgi:hypothetical protein